MWSYIVRRLILMIPTLIGVVTITFFISEFVPGGPVDQAIAQLQGKSNEGGVFELTGQGATSDKLKREQMRISEQEMHKLYRQYNLHLSIWERYLRTFLWFQQDSLTSSQEIADGESQKVHFEDTSYIVVRRGDEYFLYENLYVSPKLEKLQAERRNLTRSELFYDPEKEVLALASFPMVTFDLETGACRYEDLPDLERVPLRIEEREVSYYSAVAKGEDRSRKQTVVRREIYLDETLGEALTNWNNWHGYFLCKFGRSSSKNKSVFVLIKERLPVSARLGVFSFFCTYTVCIILGIAKAVRNGSRFDSLTSAAVLIGYSIPGFVLAVFLLKLVGPAEPVFGAWFPGTGIHATELDGYYDWPLWKQLLNNIHHMVLPLICLSIGSFAVLTMLTKNSVLDQFQQLYAVAARARGLSERKVLFKHIFRNSLIPLVTGFPASFVLMFFSGSLLIEQVFSLNGLGYLSFEALRDRDFPLIMSNLFVFTMVGLVLRLVTDICYAVVDPRISFEASRS